MSMAFNYKHKWRFGFVFIAQLVMLLVCFYVNDVGRLDTADVPLPSHGLDRPESSSSKQDVPHRKRVKINTTERPTGLSLEENITEDLKRCSLSLGISEESLRKANGDITIMSQVVAEFLQAIWSIVPQPSKFLASYKNPCWYSNIDLPKVSSTLNRALGRDKSPMHMPRSQLTLLYTEVFEKHQNQDNNTLLCLPHFFIPGFFKAGTTTLHHALVRHPQIASPKQKEPHWWARQPMGSETFHERSMKVSIAKYLTYFLGASKRISTHPKHLTFDGSVDNLYSSPYYLHFQDYCILPALLSRVLPDAKVLILMRNPVDRTYSNYLYACTLRYGKNTANWPSKMKQPAAMFHEQVVLTIHNFRACLKTLSLIECVNVNRFNGKGTLCGEVGFCLTVSLYYIHIAKWMQFYSREQFLFLKTEEMSSDSYKFLTRITQFLSLTPPTKQQAQSWLKLQANTQAFATNSPDFQMKIETRKILEEFFRPYNLMVAELVGDNRFLWMD